MVPLLLQCCVVSPIPHWRQTKNRYRRSVYESTPWEALVLRIYSTGKTALDSLSVKDPRHNTLGPEILMPSQPHLSSPEHSLQGAARQPGGLSIRVIQHGPHRSRSAQNNTEERRGALAVQAEAFFGTTVDTASLAPSHRSKTSCLCWLYCCSVDAPSRYSGSALGWAEDHPTLRLLAAHSIGVYEKLN